MLTFMITSRTNVRVTVCVGIMVLTLVPLPLFAATGLLPCEPLKSPDPATACKIEDLIALAVGVYELLLGLAGLVAILVIIASGVGMLTHSFFEQPEQVLSSAKLGMMRGITGFVIIASAYLVTNILLTALGVKTDTVIGGLLKQYGLFEEQPPSPVP